MLVKSQSKRLPQKNTREFNGRPMFLWNLGKMLKIFDEVYVSSDSYEILQLASLEGAKGIHRGKDLCGDTPDIPVFQHALKKMGEVDGIVAVHANNPNIEKNLIAMTKKIMDMGVQEVMTCYPMTKKTEYKKQGNPIYGSIRGISKERLLNYKDPFHPEPEVLLVDNSLEIETIDDFNLCQSIHQSL
jgi:CMP-N-acetylneuraminic acid synthetase